MKTFVEWIKKNDPEVYDEIFGLGKKKEKPVQKTVRWTPQRRKVQPQQIGTVPAPGSAKWIDVKGRPEVGRA